jgi:hypothetical protein
MFVSRCFTGQSLSFHNIIFPGLCWKPWDVPIFSQMICIHKPHHGQPCGHVVAKQLARMVDGRAGLTYGETSLKNAAPFVGAVLV